MSHAIVCAALVALVVVGSPTIVRTEAPTALPQSVWKGSAAVNATHPLLRTRLVEIARRSSLWRHAIAEVTRAGRRTIVLTPTDLIGSSRESGPAGWFDETALAEVALVAREDTRVDVVFVVVNLPLIERIQRRTGALPAEMAADLDRILVHEVYGHALPYLLAGDLSGKCADPQPGQQARDACAIRRENAVRSELGFNRRLDYGLSDLALVRRSWQ
jgi:hypothetical protein